MTNLLVLGASVRAAACSARRAQLHPWGADLFGDVDLQLYGAGFRRVANYPKDFLRVAREGSPGPWLYTGGLENWPGLVEEIASGRPLWGNPAAVIRRVRSPRAVYQVLSAAGVPCPAVCENAVEVPHQGRWLAKPRAAAGGRGITFWKGKTLPLRGHYFQEFIAGEACAAVYVGERARAELLGVTRQLVGQPWLHAGPFQYCGSIGPVSLPSTTRQACQHLGDALAAGFQLQGLFGVDCVLRDGVPWPVEVNPRYTASVEVLELTTGLAALGQHRQVFEPSAPAVPVADRLARAGVIGKVILFAREELIFPEDGPWCQVLRQTQDIWDVPLFADIPPVGQTIAARRPILTIFARSTGVAGCLDLLRRIARDLDRRLLAR